MKKALSLLLALCMVLGVSVSAFAATKQRLVGSLEKIMVDDEENDGSKILQPNTTSEIYVRFAYNGSQDKGAPSASVYDYEFDVSANNKDIEIGRIRKYSIDNSSIGVRFEVTVPADFTSKKEIKFTINCKPDSTDAKKYFRNTPFSFTCTVKYEEFDINSLYKAYEEMLDYEDEYFSVTPNTPVIPKDTIKFLRNELRATETAYFDFETYGIGITGTMATKLAQADTNFAASTEKVTAIQNLLDKAGYDEDVDYLSFASGDKLKQAVHIGILSDNGGEYVYRYTGTQFYPYKVKTDSPIYDLEFDAYIMGKYIVTPTELPKSIVYQSSTSTSNTNKTTGSTSGTNSSNDETKTVTGGGDTDKKTTTGSTTTTSKPKLSLKKK